MICRHCRAALHDVFVDLGTAPASNAFLSHDALARPELYLPLKLYTCTSCWLVQVDEIEKHDVLFAPDYAYFSSYSRSWLQHAERYVEKAVARLGLDGGSRVVEIASNDGYLLQYVQARGIPALGIEPTAGTAAVAQRKGIETLITFFGHDVARTLAAERGRADLMICNNVLAHVPDLNDFVAGLAAMLARGGAVTIEVPHLYELIRERQFDTIYHEHFSYFSLHTLRTVLGAHGLEIWDVEQLPTHGGSLRLWASHAGAHAIEPSVARVLDVERAAGMLTPAFYSGFQQVADAVKNDFVAFLLEQKRAGRTVAGYGAAAKGNTLLNYAGVRSDLLAFVVDASPHKQGRFLPGSRIPVVAEAVLRERRPDCVVILPWNLRDEIAEQLRYVREWNARFVTAVPSLSVFPA